VPKTNDTKGMLGAKQFARARKGLLVVNAARGGIVDEKALLEALESGQCGGAALDVYEQEPPAADSPLRTHPRILCTPHLGASTFEAQEAVAVDACKALLTYLRGEGALGAVNAGGLELNLSDRQKALVDLARRMVALLGAASQPKGIRSVRFTCRGESVASRADTIARFALAGLLRQHLDEPVNVINAALVAEQRHIEFSTVIASEHDEDRLAIEADSDGAVGRVEGAMYGDQQPRVTNINGYPMDMVPAGHMVLLTNNDQPGRIGLVGRIFGEANCNIAEMVIGRQRKSKDGGQVAMMILKLDAPPSDDVLKQLREAPGIFSVASIDLPEVDPAIALQE
jgi:D-3-phosphoglycerate dehydrogenase